MKFLQNHFTSILHLFKTRFSIWPRGLTNHRNAQGFCSLILRFWEGFFSARGDIQIRQLVQKSISTFTQKGKKINNFEKFPSKQGLLWAEPWPQPVYHCDATVPLTTKASCPSSFLGQVPTLGKSVTDHERQWTRARRCPFGVPCPCFLNLALLSLSFGNQSPPDSLILVNRGLINNSESQQVLILHK